MKDKVLRKIFTTQKHVYELNLAVCFNLFEFLPHITYGNQKNPRAYRGIHKFIEVGWLIFHAKIVWRSINKEVK